LFIKMPIMKATKLILGLTLLCSLAGMPACKTKKSQEPQQQPPAVTNTNSNATAAPVEISSDQELNQRLTDATKDFPGVQATTSNGEVTLTGTLERDRLPKLMQSIHALNPRKVNNQLTLK